jgi:hypothetical protein
MITKIPIGLAASLAGALFLCNTRANAQVLQILPFRQTTDLLVGDSFTSKVLRCHDGDNDGLYNSAGEVFLYFDPAVAIDPNTGLPYGAAKLGNPVSITVDLQGNVYVVDAGTTRTLFVTRDLNGDGDANDAGESRIFFDPTNAAGLNNFSMWGSVAAGDGTLYVTAAGQGTGFTNIDRIFHLVDLNNDGDALDAGEATVVYDRNTAIGNGAQAIDSPAWMGSMADGTLYLTNGFSSNQGVWRLVDLPASSNGRYDDMGEVQNAYTGLGGNPVPKFSWCSRFGVDGALYVLNQTDKKLIRAVDLNANFIYDDVGEGAAFCATGDGGILWSAIFELEVAPDGSVLIGDTGGAPNNRILKFKDLNNNGNAQDPGEQSVLLSFGSTPFPTSKPKCMAFLPVEPSTFGSGCPTSFGPAPTLEWVRSGGIAKFGTTTFRMQSKNLAPFSPAYLIYADATFPIVFDTIAPGLSDPSCILYPSIFSPELNAIDLGYSDGAGEVLFDAAINANPALMGTTFTAQILAVDTLATVNPIVFSNALLVPIL